MDALAAQAKEQQNQNEALREYQPTQDYNDTTQFTNQLQQSQQVSLSTHQENQIQTQNNQIQQQNNSNNNAAAYPIPKPKSSNNNRPSTQHQSVKLTSSKAQDIIYNPQANNTAQSFQTQQQNYIRSNSNQRPTPQGAFPPQNFNNTGYDGQITNSLNYANQQAQFQMTTFNRKNSNSDKPPINNFVSSQRQQQFSQEKDGRGRRQIITQILKMQNNSATDVSQSNMQMDPSSPLKNQKSRDISSGSVINLKRKKIKELLFGSGSRTSYGLNAVEKEELQHDKRNLKVQMNVMKDENTRLKTKLQIFQQELLRKDKDIELLSMKIQQSFGNTQVKDTSNIFESFLVSQLKKQNRDMKQEIDMKDQAIEKLRKDIKLTRIVEVESELQQYIDECNRLRSMLEQVMLQSSISQQQQMQQEAQDNYVIKEQARIEEAFYEKEVQLQQELEMRSQLEAELQAERVLKNKIEKKWGVTEIRLKKFNDILNENKRKQKIINDRNIEVSKIREELDSLRDKAKDRDQINNKNKELITKYYSQQSQLDFKEKRIQELSKLNNELQEQLKQASKSKQPSQFNTVSPARVTDPKKIDPEIPKPPQPSSSFSSTQYNANQLDVIFRAIKNQPLTNSNDSMIYKNYYNGHKVELHKEIDYIKCLELKSQVLQVLQPKLELLKLNDKFKSFSELEKFVDQKLQVTDKDQKKYLIFHLILAQAKALNDITLSDLIDQISMTNTQSNTSRNPDIIVSPSEPNEEEQKQQPQQQQRQQQKLQQNPLQKQQQQQQQQYINPQKKQKQEDDQQQQQEEQAQESINTVRVNENIGETTAQFIPPADMNQTPIADGKNKSGGSHRRDQSSNLPTTIQKAEEDEEEEAYAEAEAEADPDQDAYEEDEFEKITENDTSQNKVQQQDEKQEEQFVNISEQPPQEEDEEAYGEEEEGQDEKQDQISEDQMLNIAEYVFQIIADQLKNANISVKKAFAKNCQLLSEFEGETNVIIIQAKDFLESLKGIGITTLSELEIACLMRVLSKPEIRHAIVFSELNLVLENFGIALPGDDDDQDTIQEKVEKKKQKLTKKKQMKALINSEEGQELYEILASVVSKFKFDIDAFMNIFKSKQYDQMVKSKKKELKVELVNKEDFLKAIQDSSSVKLDEQEEIIEILKSLLQIDPKYSDIFQIKSVHQLFNEAILRKLQEDSERQALQEFYQASQQDEEQEEVDDQNGGNQQPQQQQQYLNKSGHQPTQNNQSLHSQQHKKQEVLNFEDIMNEEEEEDYYAGEVANDESHDGAEVVGAGSVVGGSAVSGGSGFNKRSTLNAISEDAVNEESSPNVIK